MSNVREHAALVAACARLDVVTGQVWAWRVYPDRVNVVLLDGRKFTFARPVEGEGEARDTDGRTSALPKSGSAAELNERIAGGTAGVRAAAGDGGLPRNEAGEVHWASFGRDSLRELARDRGVAGYSKMDKRNLVKALKAWESERK